jgi:hypothetical protein
VIGELFGQAPHGAVTTLGFLPWYSTLWFELATRWLPFHRVMWEVGPWVASIAGILAVAWATVKVAGRWAGALVVVVLVCAGDRLLPVQIASDLHGSTAVCVCLLDAFLVALVVRDGRVGGRWVNLAACVLVAAVTASGLASDQLLYPAGLVPFAAAGLAQLWWRPTRAGRTIAVTTVAVAAGAVVGAWIAVAAMRAHHVYAASNPLVFARWTDLVDHAAQLAQSLVDLFNGDPGGAGVGARSVLTVACGAVVAAGAVIAWQAGRSQLRRLRDRRAGDLAREAHVLFWLLALLLPAAAFVLTTHAAEAKGRYLVSAGYGIVVIAAVALSRMGLLARAAGAAAACVLVLGSVVALAKHDLVRQSSFPSSDFASTLGAFAGGEHLKFGYAAYWNAAPLTWDLHGKVQVFPLEACDAPHGLCRPAAHFVSSWYGPRPATRTFLITDKVYGPTAPRGLGAPAEVVTIGRYTISVYDDDIGAAVGPSVAPG